MGSGSEGLKVGLYEYKLHGGDELILSLEAPGANHAPLQVVIARLRKVCGKQKDDQRTRRRFSRKALGQDAYKGSTA